MCIHASQQGHNAGTHEGIVLNVKRGPEGFCSIPLPKF